MSDQKPLPNKKFLLQRYKDAAEYLDNNYAYFLTHVLNIGRPEWNATVPTAAVLIELESAGFLQGKLSEVDYDNFKFVFNPEFLASLDVEETAFILAHETYHILLNHLKLVDNFVDRDALKKARKAQEEGKRMTRDEIRDALVQNQNAMRFNIAADCVINDMLSSAGFKAIKGAMMGMEQVGVDTSHLTVTEVYELLEAQAQQQSQQTCPTCGGTGQKPQENQDGSGQDQQDDGEGDKEEGDSGSGGQDQNDQGQDGSGKSDDHQHGDKGEPCPDCQGSGQGMPGGDGTGGNYRMMDSHEWMLDPEYAEKLADAIDKMNDELEKQHDDLPSELQDKKQEEQGKQTQRQQQLQKSMQPGTEDGNMQAFMDQGIQLAFAKLLKEIDPNIFKEPGIAPPLLPSFHQRRRKLQAAQFKKVNLPVYARENRIERQTNEKPSIVLALDTSGSIGPRDAARFVTLARSIPQERIKLYCITFTTEYREQLDLDNPRYSSGGTDFTCIGRYIENKVKPDLKGKYPKAVVVITDGQAYMDAAYAPQTDAERDAWTWLMSPSDCRYGPSNEWGKKFKLDEFIA